MKKLFMCLDIQAPKYELARFTIHSLPYKNYKARPG